MSRRTRPNAPVSSSLLGPDLPELQHARALWQLNRFDEALAAFDRAARKCPNNALALIDASRAFGARFEIARAEELLDRLIHLRGRDADTLHLAGQSYRMIFRPDKAIDCFQRALALRRDLVDAQLELALMLERRHKLDEALTRIDECLGAEPAYAAAVLIRARLFRRLKRESEAETIARDLATDDDVHPQIRAQAWTEVAQLLDRHGEYDHAMECLLRAKSLLLPEAGPYQRESDVVLKHLGTLCRSVTRSHLDRWAGQTGGFEPRRNAVLCGFPRTGTTLLEQILDSHSGLVSSDEREAFARDIFPALWRTATTPWPEVSVLDEIPNARLQAQRERYFQYMEAALNEPIGSRVHLDKNPTLTLLLPAILRLLPETRILVALRDPRDVVLSCFMQYLPMNPNSVSFLSLEQTARRYAFDMEIWCLLRAQLPETWLEVRYEDTVNHLEREARRALSFLGLEWETGVLAYRERLKEKPVASPTYEAVSRPVYTSSIGRWHHYEKYFQPVEAFLRPSLKAFGYS